MQTIDEVRELSDEEISEVNGQLIVIPIPINHAFVGTAIAVLEHKFREWVEAD